MSWKYVLRYNGSFLYDAVKLARSVGYEFVLFNGEIWFLDSHNHYKTSITVDDLF